MFIVEYYFQQPSTKYNWKDFRKKVFKKDDGAELRRKMIIKNLHSTTEMEYIELKHVCLHMNAVIQSRNVDEHEFKKLYEFFSEVKQYLYDYFIYHKIKEQRDQSRRFDFTNPRKGKS